MQKAVLVRADFHEGGLDARLDVLDAAQVDVAHVALGLCPLDVKLFEHRVLDDGDAVFVIFGHIDQDSLFHRYARLPVRRPCWAPGSHLHGLAGARLLVFLDIYCGSHNGNARRTFAEGESRRDFRWPRRPFAGDKNLHIAAAVATANIL